MVTIRAELTGSNIASALGILCTSPTPILSLCRQLLRAGHDARTPLEAYRGETLCVRLPSIGTGAALTVRDNHSGVPVFATYRDGPDAPKGRGGPSPMRLNVSEVP
jgi:hypothetical protein